MVNAKASSSGADVTILAIETSCDETAAAVVRNGREVVSSVVSTQSELHNVFGGVVPEIASRAHLERINGVVAQALVEAGLDFADVDAVAACHGPGLAGALLVGVAAAKSVALATGRPYVGVHHHEAHVYASFLEDPDLEPPIVTLVASGGHTLIVAMDEHGRYRVLGQTVDDAAGEAFDKVARFLGLGYPGGPAIDRLALNGAPDAIAFPRPMVADGLDFSFSGLKTAVINHCRARLDGRHVDKLGAAELDADEIADVAASFQAAVVDVLAIKLFAAAAMVGAPTVAIGGGVAANSLLRSRVLDDAARVGLQVCVPSRELCADNAAMIGAVAYWQLRSQGPTGLDDGATPNLRIPGTG